MEKKSLWIIGIVLVVLIIVFAVTNSKSGEEGTIKIGVVGVTSGFGAYYGQQQTKGLELAKEEINNNGGVNGKQIELIYEDSAANPLNAVSAVQKLINVDGVKFIIGDSWISTTAVMVPVTNENDVFLISPLALLDGLSQDDLFFRTMPHTKDMIKPLAEYAYNEMGSRKVGIIQQQTAYGEEHTRDFTQFFEALGGEVVGVETISLTEKDLKTELIKLKEKNPDTIFNLHASSAAIGLVIKQAIELDMDVNWIGSFGSENSPLIQQYGDIAEGLTYPYPYDAESNVSSVKAFVSSYKERYGELPDMTASNSYDCLKLLKKAIEENGDSPQEVKEYLLGVEDYQGGSGVISFDQNGDVKKPIFMKRIENGRFVRIP